MPEGHTIHRYAREHRRWLRGRAVEVSSPQGRFAAGARLLDGRTLLTVDAYGKHLFYRFQGAATLHVHLGLYGGFRELRMVNSERGGDGWSVAEVPPPTPGTRLQLRTPEVTIRLSGPTSCELLDPDGETRIRARLGPDPLRRDSDAEAVAAALRRRTTPIGAALLDQKVVAGIGNVFRAEALFVCGTAPLRPANLLDPDDFQRLWATIRGMLAEGLRMGRIVTVEPAEVGKRTRGRLLADERHYVYRRAGLPCRRCGTAIRAFKLAARTAYACPTCQPW
ncbi:MAG: hypothetical protein M3493_05400 [Actinomycetota bacterium]|nr:Fpg/Nei family DNA glycosylase [Euzebyaceae bacterium]MDQ3452125.1 hypothetical protein [Actinomycetota bacterium]